MGFGPIGRGRRPLTDAETVDRSIIVVWLATIGFGWLTVQGFLVRHELNASQSWPSADGRIEASGISVRGIGGRRGNYIRADITYSYKVGIDSYLGSRIGIGDTGSGLRTERSLVSRYPVGAAVRVYYRPDDPRHAVLDRSGDQAPGWLLVVELLATLILLRFAIVDTRSDSDARRKTAAAVARHRDAPLS